MTIPGMDSALGGGGGTSPSFLSALSALTGFDNSLGSGGSFLNGGGTAQAMGAEGGGPMYSPAVTLQQIVQALAGPAPTPVQPVAPGPAPTLGDYFSAAPYQQAIGQVTAGEKNSINSVNAAYQQALNAALAQGKTSAAQAAQYVGNAKTDAANAGAQEQANINTALGGAAPGSSLLGNQLAGTQATLNANNQRGVQNAQFIQQLVGSNNANFTNDINASKANALQFLNSQVQGELAKIALGQANDQARGQQLYDQALRAYQTGNQNAINSAAATNAKDATAYQSATQAAAKQVMAMEQALAMSPHQQLTNTLNGPNLLEPQVVNLFNTVTQGMTSAQAQALGLNPQQAASLSGSAKNLPEAMQRLQSSGVDPGVASAVADMLNKYFNNTKQAPSAQDLEAYMAQMLGVGGQG